MQSGLVDADNLLRKFAGELPATEINLPVYHVAAVNGFADQQHAPLPRFLPDELSAQRYAGVPQMRPNAEVVSITQRETGP